MKIFEDSPSNVRGYLDGVYEPNLDLFVQHMGASNTLDKVAVEQVVHQS